MKAHIQTPIHLDMDCEDTQSEGLILSEPSFWVQIPAFSGFDFWENSQNLGDGNCIVSMRHLRLSMFFGMQLRNCAQYQVELDVVPQSSHAEVCEKKRPANLTKHTDAV